MRGLSVIIPSRNAANLVPCGVAIRAAEGRNVRCIVVDDGLDERAQAINGPWAEVVPGVKPFSFPRNINIGILAAGSDDVVLCNDDALLQASGGFSALRILAEQ